MVLSVCTAASKNFGAQWAGIWLTPDQMVTKTAWVDMPQLVYLTSFLQYDVHLVCWCCHNSSTAGILVCLFWSFEDSWTQSISSEFLEGRLLMKCLPQRLSVNFGFHRSLEIALSLPCFLSMSTGKKWKPILEPFCNLFVQIHDATARWTPITLKCLYFNTPHCQQWKVCECTANLWCHYEKDPLQEVCYCWYECLNTSVNTVASLSSPEYTKKGQSCN